MSPEAAMEQYVALLSREVPGWSADDPHVSICFGTCKTQLFYSNISIEKVGVMFLQCNTW